MNPNPQQEDLFSEPPPDGELQYSVRWSQPKEYSFLLLEHHYAKRIPSVSFAVGLYSGDRIVGVATFGSPASRNIQVGAAPTEPGLVIELNRLCVLDEAPKNTESWFLSRALKMLPPMIVVSYADTIQGHMGFVYRAANFKYAGWTDMERKTARYDYIVPGKHSRDAFRSGSAQFTEKVRRKPKVKYWTVSGPKKSKSKIEALCSWPTLDWRQYPPPTEHCQLVVSPSSGHAGDAA